LDQGIQGGDPPQFLSTVSAIPGFSFEVRDAGVSRIQLGEGVQDALLQAGLVGDMDNLLRRIEPVSTSRFQPKKPDSRKLQALAGIRLKFT
jgi:hypothetical protein